MDRHGSVYGNDCCLAARHTHIITYSDLYTQKNDLATQVEGVVEGGGEWLRISDKIFLPMKVLVAWSKDRIAIYRSPDAQNECTPNQARTATSIIECGPFVGGVAE